MISLSLQREYSEVAHRAINRGVLVPAPVKPKVVRMSEVYELPEVLRRNLAILRNGSCYATFERLVEILSLLENGSLGNTNALAARFGVSRKTIGRDLNFLRQRYGLKIVWSRSENSFVQEAAA